MSDWIAGWAASIAALFIITRLVPGIHVTGVGPLLWAVVALSLMNSFIRPVILFFFSAVNCLTFGLFGFLLNIVLFLVVGSGLVPGFLVEGFGAAFLGSLLMGLLSGLLDTVLKSIRPRRSER